jgi:SAM-dependent methyltransferase
LYLAEQGATPVGIDISLEACRAAFESGGYLATSQANAELLPLVNRSSDAAVFMGTLEHFISPENALREAIRVLKPGAQLCFVVPNSSFLLFRLFGGTGQPHEVPRTCEGWRELFERAGLGIEMVYRDTGPGVFEGRKLLRGLMRRLLLSFSNLMPLRYTYQFVFICHIPAERIEHASSRAPVDQED